MKQHAHVKEVVDGDTFWTKNKIRLARVYAPELNTTNGSKAKKKLENLILRKDIVYEQVGSSYDRIVAEVWHKGININDVMINFIVTL